MSEQPREHSFPPFVRNDVLIPGRKSTVQAGRLGKVVRDYLRKKYPDHPKYQRWVLDDAHAAAVHVNVPRKR